jgi:hypothetical protein
MKKVINILFGIMMAITVVLVVMMVAGGRDAAGNPDVSGIIVWTYVLFALGLVAALVSAVYNTFTNPSGLKGTLVSLVAIAVVLGVAYALTDSTTPMNMADGTVMDDKLILGVSDFSIYVTYFAMAAALVAAFFAEVKSAIK